MPQFGLTPAGFVPMRQSDIITAVQAQLQATFGVALNLAPQSVLGQILGITSEREALIWALAQAVYASQYPAGAEGTSVDNILALNNLRRIGAKPTKTAPTDTAGVPGFVCYGTPATVIPAGSVVSVQGSLTLQFTTDADITIAAAVNAIQILNFSSAPNSGTFTVSIVDPAGNTLTTPNIAWNAAPNTTQIAWHEVPTSGSFKLQLTSALGVLTLPTALNWNASTASIQSAIRALNAAYAGVVVSGALGTALTTTGNVTSLSNQLTGLASTTGIIIGMAVDDGGVNIPANTYVTNIIGTTVTMSASATGSAAAETVNFSAGLVINWGSVSQPTVALTSSTIAPVSGVVVDSVQAAFNTLFDSTTAKYPYTDVTCSGTIAAGSVAVNFGAGTVLTGQPTSGAQPQATAVVVTDALLNGSTVVNIAVLTTGVGTATGAPAQGIGSATCSASSFGAGGIGPNVVPAGFLTVIGSPISGWASVNNPLDCITGSLVEDDTAALTRRNTELAANANGPIDAIAEKVALVPGVVQAVGFQNVGLAALQNIAFSAVPVTGSFTLGLNGGLGLQTTPAIDYRALANVQAVYFSGAPTGGSFTITMNSLTTAAIAYTANAATVQAAVRALSGFAETLVTGSFTQGFFLAFSAGTVQQYPITTADSLTGASISATVPSVQAQINSLPGYGPTTVIGSYTTGFVLSFAGSSGGQPQQLATVPSNSLGVTVTPTFGRPGKSIEIVVNDNNGEASNLAVAEAIFGSAPGGIMTYGNNLPSGNATNVTDAFGNVYPISFSRPTQIPIYVSLTLQTDLTTSDNPQFNPGSILTIQEDIAAAINATVMGGTIIGFGSNGLIGSFNNIPGVLSYTMAFGTSPSPSSTANIQLLPEQVPLGQTYNVIVSYV